MKKSVMLLVLCLPLSFGCKDEEPAPDEQSTVNSRSGKGDFISPCKADEPVLVCMAEECGTLMGEPFDDCVIDKCQDAAADAPLACAECVGEAFDRGYDGDETIADCTSAGPETGCAVDAPVLVCLNDKCPGLVDDEFDTCFEDNCEDDAEDTRVECGLCLVNGFEAGLDAAETTAACTNASPPANGDSGPSTLTGIACSDTDADLFTCLTNECADAATSVEAGECIANNCSDEAQATTIACLMCVDAQIADSGQTTSAEPTCTAVGSSPCSVDVASALQQCANVACSGQQGNALDDCMDTECPEAFEDVSEQCGNCVIGLNGQGVQFADAAAHCAGG